MRKDEVLDAETRERDRKQVAARFQEGVHRDCVSILPPAPSILLQFRRIEINPPAGHFGDRNALWSFVIPAQAGIHKKIEESQNVDSRLRGNDEFRGGSHQTAVVKRHRYPRTRELDTIGVLADDESEALWPIRSDINSGNGR